MQDENDGSILAYSSGKNSRRKSSINKRMPVRDMEDNNSISEATNNH